MQPHKTYCPSFSAILVISAVNPSYLRRFFPFGRRLELLHLFDGVREIFFSGTRFGRLQGAIFLKLNSGFGQGLLMGHLSRMGENLTFAQLQKIIQLGNPFRHAHHLPVQGLKFGKFQIGCHDAVQRL